MFDLDVGPSSSGVEGQRLRVRGTEGYAEILPQVATSAASFLAVLTFRVVIRA
jgi:hypothetical protein